VTAALYLGLISGTSADGIEAVLAECGPDSWRGVRAHLHHDYPAALRARLLAFARDGARCAVDELVQLDSLVGDQFALAAQTLLAHSGIEPTAIRAIGSHGQTIHHRPATPAGSLQLGDPGRIAALTGIPVVGDFRRADMALGGQGAPLAPALHADRFADPHEARGVLNLGGIANLTLLIPDQPPRAFDTGPASALMDSWIQLHRELPYDDDGAWARQGSVVPALLDALLAEPYFAQPAPKSTGREALNLDWVRQRHPAVDGLAPVDVQRTLCELSARTIADALRTQPLRRLLVCGGGIHNRFLLERIHRLSGLTPESTAAHGLPPEQVEAAAFAWLAMRRMEQLPGNLPSVTGARASVALGGVYLPALG
jgi:Predicted molecular chaperone distantly related to HSP70-fold metalloproteases